MIHNLISTRDLLTPLAIRVFCEGIGANTEVIRMRYLFIFGVRVARWTI